MVYKEYMKENKLENIVALRNDLFNTRTGERLLEFLQDYITKEACITGKNPEAIKGMCEIVQRIKEIPIKVESIKK